MRWASFLLAGLALATACVVEDKPVIPPGDGGVDAGDCIFCPVDAPVCVGGTDCVQCTGGDPNYCTDLDQVCDVENQVCVDCLDDAQCTTPTASRCDTGTNGCAQCQTDVQCDGVDELPATNNTCDSGTCRECTPETETEKCAADETCNPDTYQCTGEQAGSLTVCDACVADSECGVGGEPSAEFRCVPMYYPNDQTRFPDDQTGFCLKTTDGGCERPYAITLADRSSLSQSTSSDDYCGVNEELATCPAVAALVADARCPSGEDDECEPGGLCREVGSLQNRCTYRCSDVVECKNAPVPGSTCGSSGSGNEDYCGG